MKTHTLSAEEHLRAKETFEEMRDAMAGRDLTHVVTAFAVLLIAGARSGARAVDRDEDYIAHKARAYVLECLDAVLSDDEMPTMAGQHELDGGLN